MAHISEYIRLKRRQVPLTQKELANAVGISVATMNKIESGSENINLDILIRVCDCLDHKLIMTIKKKLNKQ